MKIFDTHSHYSDIIYNNDRKILFNDMYNQGVKDIMLVGASIDSTIEERNIFNIYNNELNNPKIHFSAGIHPDEVKNEHPFSNNGVIDLEKIENLCKDDNGNIIASAFGEIGLDYYGNYDNKIPFDIQKEWFIAQIEIANKLKLPIIIHSREACEDTFNIVKNNANKNKMVIHCFSYEKEIATEYVKLGCMIGIGGVITFKNGRKLKEVVEHIPIENILTETDAPYLSPMPYRGKRNESSYIKYVIYEIAKIKNIDIEEVSNILYNNALRFYNKE